MTGCNVCLSSGVIFCAVAAAAIFLLVVGFSELRAQWGLQRRRVVMSFLLVMMGAAILGWLIYLAGHAVWMVFGPAGG